MTEEITNLGKVADLQRPDISTLTEERRWDDPMLILAGHRLADPEPTDPLLPAKEDLRRSHGKLLAKLVTFRRQ